MTTSPRSFVSNCTVSTVAILIALASMLLVNFVCRAADDSAPADASVDSKVFIPMRVDSVVPAKVQPFADSPDVIFYDNFDGDEASQRVYLEPSPDSPNAKRSEKEALGGSGLSMECFYAKGERGIGNRKIVFGDCPFGRPLRRGEKFDDIYWRIYVKHQRGWTGGSPAKMSRATGFVSNRWNQAFIAHVWGSGDVLTLDPVSGVRNGQVFTTRYNDFDNFRWLGNSPKGKFPIHTTEQSGRWVCVEARLKLNAPGKKDGYCALWIDGRLDTERKNMDFRGTYTDHTINAVFLEAYWNQGSPVDQYRWYDDFVVSTAPIGPVRAEAEPTLIVTRPEVGSYWIAEIGVKTDTDKDNTKETITPVWRSDMHSADTTRVTATAETGKFAEGRTGFIPGRMYYCRTITQMPDGGHTQWTEWHQPFYVAKK